ncbi:MAG TPA: class I SAM-dependent methyltransferase [Acidimicrobiales bacterium]|nr:class I SAM-dependent methyltransferase [Acidimicrobiales bacterium]
MTAVARPLSPLGRRVLALYAGEPRAARLHTRIRWRTCPFGEVVAALEGCDDVLEVGCGHGLLSLALALDEPARRVTGIDVDAGKIAVARQVAARSPGLALPERLTFSTIEPGHLPAGSWDGIAMVDVLYLVPPTDQEALVMALAARVRPGGRLVVKEMAETPRAKALLNRAQETVSVRIARITEGEVIAPTSPDDLDAWMRTAGLTVERRRVDRGYPHPHHLVVGTRPEDA